MGVAAVSVSRPRSCSKVNERKCSKLEERWHQLPKFLTDPTLQSNLSGVTWPAATLGS